MCMFYLFVFYLLLFSIFFFFFFMYLYINKLIYFFEIYMFKFDSITIEFVFLFDWISMLFMSVVFLISMLVMLYSLEYMINDKNINRFMWLLMLFVISMMLMVLSPNLISIMLGWDGLGLSSYCLVIYYQSESSFNSGMVTVLTNRLGDIFLLFSISLMFMYGSFNILFLMKMNYFLLLLMIFASITKSAQIPFSSWLPMAMAAPTPVSALVHSSTLVTAGVYLLIRFNYLMKDSILLQILMLLSVITMFMSGMGANFEFDLKKIIALSTLSQLGVMIFSLSLGLKEVSLFHLLMHALFKSMLFMCSGIIIHNMMNNQDIRYISMVLINMPVVSLFFNCSVLSLCGIPFLSGFFSKDLILEMFLMSIFNKFIFIILFISMGLTVMYSFRLIYYVYIKIPQINIYVNYNFMGSLMGVSMIFLFIYSIIMGLVMSWILFSMKNLIYLPIYMKMMVFYFMVIGMILGMNIMKYSFNKKFLIYMNYYIIFFSSLWFLSYFYNFSIDKMFLFMESMLFLMDLGWNEYFFSTNLIKYMKLIFKMDLFFKSYFLLLLFMILLMIMLILFY